MKILRQLFLIFFISLTFASLSGQNPNIKAARSELNPLIDGKLDDEAWAAALVFSDLKMVEPTPGINPSERTEIKIIYTKKALILGIKCFDAEPKKISVNTMAHDEAEERNEDQISILLDPVLDKRTGYIFIVNPKGAKSEGFASGEHLSLGWDGLWDAACRTDPDGWSAEISIPFLTLAFNPKLTSWGFNFERYIARKQEAIRYAGISLNSFFSNAGDAGILEGISDAKQGLGITFRPYAKASVNDDKTDTESAAKDLTGGFDLYKSITPNLTAALTINTDFAETEVDDKKLNLTRFPLYYPEKRTFFLEGSDIFEFGGTNSRTFLPFFSRRIGLTQGEQIPLDWGTKLFGKLGNTNISLLDVQSGTSEFAPSTNMFAGRISQNILKESRVGMIVTNGSQSGEQNTLAGADFRYKTSEFMGSDNFTIDLWGVKNWNEKKGGNKSGFGMRIDYPNDLIDASLSYNFFGDSINPGLGFLPRKGYYSLTTGLSYMPRPEKGFIGDLIRQMFFEFRLSRYWNTHGELESNRIFTAPLNLKTESGELFEFNIIHERENLPEDFEVADGIVIEKGEYSFLSYAIQAATASHRKAGARLNYSFGKFYDGTYNNIETGISLKLNGYATLEAGGNFIRGYMPEGNFAENVFNAKLNLYLSPNLGISNYVQFDDVSEQLGYNGRIFWQIRPGNIIYLVYNNHTERVFDPEARFKPLEDQVLFKVQLSIRF